MPKDPNFFDMSDDPVQGAEGSFPIAPHASDNLPKLIRAITVDVAGTIAWINWHGEAQTTNNLQPGTYAMRAKAIRVSGTTASGLTGWV